MKDQWQVTRSAHSIQEFAFVYSTIQPLQLGTLSLRNHSVGTACLSLGL